MDNEGLACVVDRGCRVDGAHRGYDMATRIVLMAMTLNGSTGKGMPHDTKNFQS